MDLEILAGETGRLALGVGGGVDLGSRGSIRRRIDRAGRISSSAGRRTLM